VLSQRYSATFEGMVYGTLQIGNQSYIANDYMKSIIDLKQKTITFMIQNIQLTENVSIFYNVFLNDNLLSDLIEPALNIYFIIYPSI
jgi:ABC-type sugar transport system ATPase subunit